MQKTTILTMTATTRKTTARKTIILSRDQHPNLDPKRIWDGSGQRQKNGCTGTRNKYWLLNKFPSRRTKNKGKEF
jgi:hypothetical protein